MVAAISSINPYISTIDSEYLRILAELRKLGISPSGSKAIDAGKLEQAKTELITKIKNKDSVEHRSDIQTQIINPADDKGNSQRMEMEEQRLGAMTIAELNRLYFGI